MMLEVEGLSFSYGSQSVLTDITFSVRQHEIVAVMGSNGAGKTTLLRCINHVLSPDSGNVTIEGTSLDDCSGREIARKVAYVAQRTEPGKVTAFDAVLLGRKPYIGWRVSHHDLELVQAALHLLDLEPLSLRYTHQMSGGEFQKVCIARALVQEPHVMLLDEPTSSLDLRNQLAILRLLGRIIRGHKMCAVITMHDLNTAFRYANRFLFLKDNSIFADVCRSEITAEMIRDVYDVPVTVQWHQDHPFILPVDDVLEDNNL